MKITFVCPLALKKHTTDKCVCEEDEQQNTKLIFLRENIVCVCLYVCSKQYARLYEIVEYIKFNYSPFSYFHLKHF